MSKHNVKFTIDFDITVEEKLTVDGLWYYAKSKYGGCNSNSEADCVRILTERAKEQAGLNW